MPKLNSEVAARNTSISLPMTPYQAHVARWRECDRCELAAQRRRVVFGRGVVPADVLFAGEAPGTSENASGVPFDGPAGDLLNRIVKEAFDLDTKREEGFFRCPGDDRPMPRLAFYNVVSCFPKEAKRGNNHQPPIGAIRACSAKMREFYEMCRPKLVVCVGGTAEKYIHLSVDAASEELSIVHILHPAAILRDMPLIQKDGAVRQCVVRVAKAAERAGLL